MHTALLDAVDSGPRVASPRGLKQASIVPRYGHRHLLAALVLDVAYLLIERPYCVLESVLLGEVGLEQKKGVIKSVSRAKASESGRFSVASRP